MIRKKFRIAAAAVSVLAIGLWGVAAPATFADTGDPTKIDTVSQENTSNTALINATATVRLQIHKYLGAPVEPQAAGNGTEQAITGKDPLSGVKFDVYQVFTDAAHNTKVDLTTNAGWAAASAIYGHVPTPAEIATGIVTVNLTPYYLGTPTQVTTDATGTAKFTKTDGVGLYLVRENVPASTNVVNETTHQSVPTSSITPTAPFFVTLPMTDPTVGNRWMYDVNVYPKNQSDIATKAVTTQGTNTAEGGNLASTANATFTVTTGITDGLTGAQMGMYVVYDNLDPRLDFLSASVALDGTTPPALVRCTTKTQTGCDYMVFVGADGGTLTLQPSDVRVDGGPIVQIVFTDDGLVKLAANSDGNVVTTINTSVNAEGATGVIPNMATFIPNQAQWRATPGTNWTDPENPDTTTPPTAPDGGTPSDPTQLKYGDLVITKQDPAMAANAADMEGAEFKVYAISPVGAQTCSTAVNGTAIASATIPTTAGIDNTVTIKGLETSDFYLNATQTTLQYYCLVETKAPAGYNLLAEPIMFTILQKFDTPNNPTVPVLAVTDQTVNNEKSNLGNNLPLTGGEGVAALSLGGLLLIGGGVGYYAYTSRRRRNA